MNRLGSLSTTSTRVSVGYKLGSGSYKSFQYRQMDDMEGPELQCAEEDHSEKITQGKPAGQHGMKFVHQKDTKNVKCHEILRFLSKPVDKRHNKPGFIYCFREKSAPGYLKIGSTEIKDT